MELIRPTGVLHPARGNSCHFSMASPAGSPLVMSDASPIADTVQLQLRFAAVPRRHTCNVILSALDPLGGSGGKRVGEWTGCRSAEAYCYQFGDDPLESLIAGMEWLAQDE